MLTKSKNITEKDREELRAWVADWYKQYHEMRSKLPKLPEHLSWADEPDPCNFIETRIGLKDSGVGIGFTEEFYTKEK